MSILARYGKNQDVWSQNGDTNCQANLAFCRPRNWSVLRSHVASLQLSSALTGPSHRDHSRILMARTQGGPLQNKALPLVRDVHGLHLRQAHRRRAQPRQGISGTPGQPAFVADVARASCPSAVSQSRSQNSFSGRIHVGQSSARTPPACVHGPDVLNCLLHLSV